MPELPEVETSRRGIAPHIEGQCVTDVVIRQRQLRWPIPQGFKKKLVGQTIADVSRRSKYLLLNTDNGSAILHLGMSGRLHILPQKTPAQKHDHVDICFANGKLLRFTDPRRFGCLLWSNDDPHQHKLLATLGPEPLDKSFNAAYLWEKLQKSSVAIKQFIMNSKIVVGVGNIYANEALFMSGIHPKRPAKQLSEAECKDLVKQIKQVLKRAIKQGGTTLKDFLQVDGNPGYFRIKLKVYGRAGEACVNCGTTLQEIRLGQRSTVFCGECQK